MKAYHTAVEVCPTGRVDAEAFKARFTPPWKRRRVGRAGKNQAESCGSPVVESEAASQRSARVRWHVCMLGIPVKVSRPKSSLLGRVPPWVQPPRRPKDGQETWNKFS